jgi:putative membrane protein
MDGHEPDYRFTFANERTFLAWIRTSLALDAAGLAVVGFLPPSTIPFAREALALALLGLGTFLAAASLRQWERNQAAVRLDAPLPPSPLLRILAGGVVIAAGLAVLIALTGTEA